MFQIPSDNNNFPVRYKGEWTDTVILSTYYYYYVCVCVCLTLSIISGPVLEAQSEDIHVQEGEDVAMWVQGPHPLNHMDAQVYIEDDVEEEEYNNIIP